MWRALKIGLLAVVVGIIAIVAVATAGRSTGKAQARPVLAVVGASISYGIGADGANQAWPAVLGKQLGWRTVVSADPGAGYLAPGQRARGPMRKLLAELDLTTTHPSVVIVQAGYNDIGMPAAQLTDSVRQVVRQIHAEAPGAAIGVLTVFPKGRPSEAAAATDAVIVSAARSADPHVAVFDPITAHWMFPTVTDRLHPTPAGHRWIADRMLTDFRRDGLVH
ncbi:SGNH/GDSL hydrolase family protein [Nocardia terpenica]|uniref:SGNH hydrolase-type esterase domain-containing protein n=1 Tax=Nocardia terpenica TaxID=455432 RepID=A0A164I5B3_9NOCA|nr:SGNH/GDSL hydrolase family protein [Nocardia terpenica]KZM69114.1 hypothetical protein AWN90_15450 [Nocardia terpenica]MBF6061625.1 SGNH/GDSL hydrolase family protein [Nocardia terpenica]MBF6107580.1 SGNH/GDSL hydrolase family protein [Nocardia terpenica]MBF6110045.1 SGNH/GDSL hydrolase family protein [Nocardia terpenica]MBF6122443.1 SGNH/GDSL hydrolase family protein [Nocardia terpenica]